MARKLAAVAFSLGCFHAGSLMALGLGDMKLESFLNEPLRASVDLLNMGGLHEDEVRIRLATSEDFDKLGLERAYFLTNITFEVVSDERGGARIVIRSEEPVLEPYLDFVVEARWPSGRLLREYTVLVDPPVFSQATPVVSASERVQEVERSAAPAKKNEQVTASGTSVDVRESSLAPGAMPQRNYNATTDSVPTPGSRYMISRDQTLWEIASQAKPAGASVHQTMLEIQRLNPDAFINGNINRIKAGYIIYLPSADEINSVDLSTALAEVREQNSAWREGRDQERYASSGPSLRISAEPEERVAAVSDNQGVSSPSSPGAANESSTTSSTMSAAAAATTSGEDGDKQERLAALEQQLETLQRIVSLKDDQIAALQDALKDAGGNVEEGAAMQPSELSTETLEAVEEVPGQTTDTVVAVASETIAETPESTPLEEPEVATAPVPKAASPTVKTAPPTDSSEGWTSYLLYGLGALVLAIAAVIFARRRSAAEPEQTGSAVKAAPRDDVFSDVQLRDPNIELVTPADEVPEAKTVESKRNNRGYGEHKHDEYASDVDAADALAEADIYIAYGRHPQAVDLLNNALANEPGNPVYRLKLLEIYTELNNRVAATAQLRKIQELGDPDSISRAESLMEGLRSDEEVEPAAEVEVPSKPAGGGPGLTPNPFSTNFDAGEALEDDFSGLEIEGQDDAAVDDDLDLSGDFAAGHAENLDDEELVIAADSNGLSTKLDLARAYLDMGDDDGARQILDEVVADGSEELKAEARALLDRIGG
ncbi:MAG: FimV/HubP family polar landmark protein [Halioglobus sp.]